MQYTESDMFPLEGLQRVRVALGRSAHPVRWGAIGGVSTSSEQANSPATSRTSE